MLVIASVEVFLNKELDKLRKKIDLIDNKILDSILERAEIVKSISVNGNDRITDETVIIFSNVNIGDDLIINDLNDIVKNLYTTDFLKMFQLI